MGAFCLLLSLATGVDYGWMPEADGSLTYLIQLEPEVVAELRQPGFAIESVIPEDLRGVRRFKIYVGEGEVPRIGAPHAAVQAQWSQYVETDATGGAAAASSYTGAATDPYVGDRYLPEMFQSPDWQQRFYEWSDLAQKNLAGDAGANAGSAAPPLTLPNFGQDIAKLPGDVWNQAAQTMRERGLDPTLATDRLKQEFQQGVAGANAALDRFGDKLASEADRTIGAWTGTEINRAATPAAASSPVGTSGGGFAAAPAFAPAANLANAAPPTKAAPMNMNPTSAGVLGMPAGSSLAAPATAGAGAFDGGRTGEFAPASAFDARSNPTAPTWNGGALAGSAATGGSLAGGGLGGSLGGGSSLDAPPLTGSNLGGSSLDATSSAGGSLAGGSLGGGSSLDVPAGNMSGGLATGSSLDMPPASNLGGPAGGSLGGGSLVGGAGALDGAGSLAGGGSSLDGGSLAGGSVGGGSSLGGSLGGGSLDVPPIGDGEQPFGVPQVGGAAGDDNPFGVPIVARQEVAAERRTLPYSAIPIRPNFDSEMLAGPAAIDVTPVNAEGPIAPWGWGSTLDEQGRPWGPLFITAVILFLSVGLNCYLAWISRGLYERYKNLVFSRRHASTSAAV